MSIEDLTPKQLAGLEAIRGRRREITRAAAEEQRALMAIVNAAATRRSEKRHRFMLLAGGTVGVAGPLLLQGTLPADLALIRAGCVMLLLAVTIGAIFDAVDERRTTPVLLRASSGVISSAAAALAEDARLISATIGEVDPEIAAQEQKANEVAKKADDELRQAGEKFVEITVLESVLFFGSFLIGIILLLLAVGRVPTAG